MSLLDEPALNLRLGEGQLTSDRGALKPTRVFDKERVRFRQSSTFVRAFDMPASATGTITGTYESEVAHLAWMTIDTPTGSLYATGVRLEKQHSIR